MILAIQLKKMTATQKVKIPNHNKYIATIESIKLTRKSSVERLRQAKLATNDNLNVMQRAIKNEEKIRKKKQILT